MRNRQSEKPKRRITDSGGWAAEALDVLLRSITYTGSANHKRRPADDGFHPPVNPRPHKSLCDDLRPGCGLDMMSKPVAMRQEQRGAEGR